MPAPQDPLAMLMSQMASGLGPLNQTFASMGQMMIKGMSDGIGALDQIAPHNVLASLTKGAGTFSAKMTTGEIDRMNIFG